MALRSLFVLLALAPCGAALFSGCASAPAFRAEAIVRVTGKGDRAWQNAREAVAALTLRQNLARLERDVRRRRLRMLDADDPVAVLQDAVVAKRVGEGKVRLRVYGDHRRELRVLCRALLALWETEGVMGRSPKRAPPRIEDDEPAQAPTSTNDREKSVRARLYGEKQKLLSEQVDLGQKWQDAERRAEELNKESAAARKALVTADQELQKLRTLMSKPERERIAGLGDADVVRLHTEVRESEAALQKASSLPAEIRVRVEQVLARKKKALAIAEGRFEKEAEARATDAKERVTSVEQKLDVATRAQSDVRGRRYALEGRLGQIEKELASVDVRVKSLSASTERRPTPPPRRTKRLILEEAKVYRMREVIKPCRVYRIAD